MLIVSLLLFAVRTPSGTPEDPYRHVSAAQQRQRRQIGQRMAARRARTKLMDREADLRHHLKELKEKRTTEEEKGKLADPDVLAEIDADAQRIQQELDALRAELKRMANDGRSGHDGGAGNGNGNRPDL
jgi:hypothetical protein